LKNQHRRIASIAAATAMFALAAAIEMPWSLLVWVALVPWLLSLDREESLAGILTSGLLMTVGYVLAVFAWFAPAFAGYTGTPTAVAFALLAVGAPFLQPQFAAFAVLRHLVRRRSGSFVLAAAGGAFAWIATEWACPRLFGDTLGHGLYPFVRVRQAADIAGAGGLTLAAVVVNEALASTVRNRRTPRRAVAAAATATIVLAALTAYGAWRIRSVEAVTPSAPPLRAALIQADYADYRALRARVGTAEGARRILDAHFEMTHGALARNPSFDLIVWPETVYPTTFGDPKSTEGGEFDERIRRFTDLTGVPLFFGTYTREGGDEFNSAVLLHPSPNAQGPDATAYRKQRLFPLTETIPSWADSPGLRNLLPWLGSWRAGDGPPVLSLRRRSGEPLSVAPLICLDAVDPDLAIEAARAGAEAIVTISNDAWFGDSRGLRLHLIVSAFRSIETRLPQLRATNTGISAVISPNGEITSATEANRRSVLAGKILPGSRGGTPIKAWGDWLGPLAAVATLVIGVAASRKRRPPRAARGM
jgi:apolipoprotein N-acyltransferase